MLQNLHCSALTKSRFKVLPKHDKFFTLDLITRIDNVCIDRLKAQIILPQKILQLLHSTLIKPEWSASKGNNNLALNNFSKNLFFPSTSGLFNLYVQEQPAIQVNRYG